MLERFCLYFFYKNWPLGQKFNTNNQGVIKERMEMRCLQIIKEASPTMKGDIVCHYVFTRSTTPFDTCIYGLNRYPS